MLNKMINKILVLGLTLIMLGCNRTDDHKSSNVFENQDLLIDSLKWLAYAINYDLKPACNENTDSLISTISLPLKIYKIINKDSIFSMHFEIEDSIRKCRTPLMFEGIIVHKDRTLFPVSHAIRWDFQNNSDSVKAFFERSEEDFKEYLRSYTGEIDAWLEQESKRRGIR